MNCQEIQNKLVLFFDNELSVQEKAEIEAHLLSCAACAKQLADLQWLTSLGKQAIFPEPPPSYWKESRLNIMNEIKAADKKPFELAALLQNLKNYIFPRKLSFRLAGLLATAVIVFFIIHIAFLRQGKFELPQMIDIRDSISFEKHETQFSKNNIEEAPALPGHPETPLPQAIPKAAPSPEPDRDQLSIAQVEPQAMMKAAERDMGIIREPSRLIEAELTFEDEGVIGQQARTKSITDETALSRREAKRVNSKPAYRYFEKNDLSSKDAARAKSAAVRKSITLRDSSDFKYQLTLRQVEEISDITEKIETWEAYLQTQPALLFLRKAKYQQAQLYFALAQAKMNEDQVNRAIHFYEKNFECLAAVADTATIEKEIQTLRQLLQKK